ncbi:MAG TPA: ribosome maturation factor RimP [Clostridiales bacterium]|nr:ribosome maturation factor RimP [Clostridia bacterium]MDD4679813.1 ribosome maturation factor RimP [Clostridia bacterium]HCS72949.1 ribosome maturation factor RimP [Clostridiales bacterium]
MAGVKTKNLVEEILQPILEQNDYELVDIEYTKEGSHWYLRIYIDKEGGVTVDDCQTVSEQVSMWLDKKDPIPHSYILEVSSPGLDRILKKPADFIRYKGYKVDVSLYKAIEGKKKFTGELIGWEEEQLLVQERDTLLSFSRNDIAAVRLAVEF